MNTRCSWQNNVTTKLQYYGLHVTSIHLNGPYIVVGNTSGKFKNPTIYRRIYLDVRLFHSLCIILSSNSKSVDFR